MSNSFSSKSRISTKQNKKSVDTNPLTIQQYNNYINIDTSKNNITSYNLDEETETLNDKKKLEKAVPIKISIKTSPSPLKQRAAPQKKPVFSTDRYVVDSLPNTTTGVGKSINSSNLIQVIKEKLASKEKFIANKRPSSKPKQKLHLSFENNRGNHTTNNITSPDQRPTSKDFKPNFNKIFKSDSFKINSLENLVEDFLKKHSRTNQKDILNDYLPELLTLFENLTSFQSSTKNLFTKLRFAIELPLSKSMETMLKLREMLQQQTIFAKESYQRELSIKGQFSQLQKEYQKLEKKHDLLSKYITENNGDINIDNIEDLFKENQRLKTVNKRNKIEMQEAREKEEKIMKLLYAIRRKGIDIESIYNENVRTPDSSFIQSEKKDLTVCDSEIKNDLYGESFSYSKNSEKENEFERNENNKIPKEQLKLNLSPVINPLDFKKCEEIKGFHEEFMSKLEEFSQSWRTAALAEKKF